MTIPGPNRHSNPADPAHRRRVCVVTGSRAEFGLLNPVMRAIHLNPHLELQVIVTGAHLLGVNPSVNEVTSMYPRAIVVEMQRKGESGRLFEAAACGRGIERISLALMDLMPHWLVVLGDRIEAFAAASAASIGGIAVAHIHGGDRAEGIADEAMRHAITKLAHLHLPASDMSAQRIIRMGEPESFVRVVGSPAIDELAQVEPMSDHDAALLGDPDSIVLMHPSGLPPARELHLITCVRKGVDRAIPGTALCLAPNFDPGRDIIEDSLGDWCAAFPTRVRLQSHMPRQRFVALLKRIALRGGILIGNSSAGLIECAALRLGVVNVGPRQNGRQRAQNVIDVSEDDLRADPSSMMRAIEAAHRWSPTDSFSHPFGDGRAGQTIAELLAMMDPNESRMLRKCCTY